VVGRLIASPSPYPAHAVARRSLLAVNFVGMRSGLSNKVVGQAGEFAVCAQLGKLGLIATPFAGNVPGFDVLAVDEHLNCVPIQVKTSRGRSWITGDLTNYCEVTRDGDRLILGELKPPRYPDLIRVYVSLGAVGLQDRFFVMSEQTFYEVALAGFKKWLDGHGGVRPKNPDSLHSAVDISSLEVFENNWHLVTDKLGALNAARADALLK
jgi:hypothetical protein